MQQTKFTANKCRLFFDFVINPRRKNEYIDKQCTVLYNIVRWNTKNNERNSFMKLTVVACILTVTNTLTG